MVMRGEREKRRKGRKEGRKGEREISELGVEERRRFHFFSGGILFLAVLGFHLRTLSLLGKHSTTELCSQPMKKSLFRGVRERGLRMVMPEQV
jgi:hypothetical protein